MESIARELCAQYIDETWRTGFAAGSAATFGLAVLVHLVMRLVDWLNGHKK
jgi:hypothetical protein